MNSGTLSVAPADHAVIYAGSIVAMSVTLTLEEPDTLPAGCTVHATVTSGPAEFEVGAGHSVTCALPLVPTSNRTASATFYLVSGPVTEGDDLNIEIAVDPVDVAAALPITYQAGIAPLITYEDPRPLFLVTAPDDTETPQTCHAVRYAARVMDGAQAIPNYIVEWRQVWDAALFDNMRPFGAPDATLPLEVVTPIDGKYAFIRGVTGPDGSAELILVPTTRSIYAQLKASADIDFAQPFERLVVFNPDAAPKGQELQILLSQTGAMAYNLDSTPGQFVKVAVPTDGFAVADPLQLLVFANGVLVGDVLRVYTPLNPLPPTEIFDISKLFFYSNTGPHAGEQNNFYYVVAARSTGVSRSASARFLAVGDRGSAEPPAVPRVLDEPTVQLQNGYVNVDVIKDNLQVQVPLRVAPSIWTPAAGDTVKATIYLNGWTPEGATQARPFDATRELTDADVQGGDWPAEFDRALVAGYDPSPDIPSKPATFSADYRVLPKGLEDVPANYLYSKLFTGLLDTAAPGSVSVAPAVEEFQARHAGIATGPRGTPSHTGAFSSPGAAAAGLAAPKLPQADSGGVIDLDGLGSSITVVIPAYTDLRPKDSITVYIDDTPCNPLSVPAVDPLPQQLEIQYPKDGLALGEHRVWYISTDIGSQNAATSPETRLSLKSSSLPQTGGRWAGVSAVGFNFAGVNPADPRAVRIYANGLHQASLRVWLRLTDANNAPLQHADYPSIQDVMAAVKLIDYDARIPLGTGTWGGWSVTQEPNAFAKHLPPAAGASSPGIAIGSQADSGSGNYVSDSTAYFTVYITCSSSSSEQAIGIGMQITPDGDDADVTLFNASGGDFQQPAFVAVLPALTYSSSDLSVQGARDAHDGQSDASLFNMTGPEHEGNYWRQWDYKVRLTGAASQNGNYIFQCRVQQPLPSDYAFSSRSNGLFNYKAYFWPRNLFDASGIALANADAPYFYLQAPGSPQQFATPVNQPGTLTFTLFCTFGKLICGAYDYTPADLEILDQFGNSGRFTLEPRRIPSQYDPAAFSSLSFFVDGWGQAGSGDSSSGTTGPVNVYYNNFNDHAGLKVPLGLCNDGDIVSSFHGRHPLQLSLRNEQFNFEDVSGQDLNAGRIYKLSLSNVPSDGSKYVDFTPDDLNAPVCAADTATRWYLGPIWGVDGFAVCAWNNGQEWCAWYQGQITTGSSTVQAVFAWPYSDQPRFQWKIVS